MVSRPLAGGECGLERRLAQQAILRKNRASADRFNDIAAEREAQAATIRQMLLSEEKV